MYLGLNSCIEIKQKIHRLGSCKGICLNQHRRALPGKAHILIGASLTASCGRPLLTIVQLLLNHYHQSTLWLELHFIQSLLLRFLNPYQFPEPASNILHIQNKLPNNHDEVNGHQENLLRNKHQKNQTNQPHRKCLPFQRSMPSPSALSLHKIMPSGV